MTTDKEWNQGKKSLLERYTNPSVAFRGKPFWSWNGELEKEELIRQLGVLKEMGMGGFFMHSRAGLITEYLGEEWFSLINAVADAGEALGLEAWLYDEDRWPSGSAGGKVTVDPQYRMKSLCLQEVRPEDYVWSEDLVAAFFARVDGHTLWSYQKLDAQTDVRALVRETEDGPGEAKVLCYTIVPDACNSNYNGTTYIDTMSRKATDRFLELTHEAYAKHCGDRLGRSIKGIFTDEPHRGQAMNDLTIRDGMQRCTMAWTDDLLEEFEKRYGYDALAILPELFYWPEGRRVAPIKLHYLDLADNLFLERFAKPIQEWCEAHGMIFTGHVLHEDSFSNQTVPQGSLMRFYEYMGYPGVDVLSEFNCCYWIVKQLASAARQLGKNWLLSELYGCTGWQFPFRSHKAVGDWQTLFGINVRCHHLSWYTMEGESKRDYPASILHQSPWYSDYDYVESYFARFGVVMSEGQPCCDVLVLNAIESVWCQTYAGWASWIVSVDPEISRLEQHYMELFHLLTDHQIDFDYGEEDMMARMASVEKEERTGEAILRVGKARYRQVVVSGMLTMRASTAKLLEVFLDAGGRVLFAGELPTYIDAVESNRAAKLAEREGALHTSFTAEEVIPAVRSALRYQVSITNQEDGKTSKNIYAQLRYCAEDGLYFLACLNTNREEGSGPVEISISGLSYEGVEVWDLVSGNRYDATPFMKSCNSEGTVLETSFLAGESLVLAFVKEKDQSLSPLPQLETIRETLYAEPVSYTLNEENACLLDYANWKWQGEAWQGEQEILKIDRCLRSRLGLEWRGGGMLQPWYAKNFDNDVLGTLELEFPFYIDTLPKETLTLAAERPEYHDYFLNGHPLTHRKEDGIWVDACFKRMPIPTECLKLGRNTVTVRMTFRRTTNLEALYLIGNFGVHCNQDRPTITSLPDTVDFRPLEQQHLPFYTGGLSYHLTQESLEKAGICVRKGSRIFLSPQDFGAALWKVSPPGAPEKERRNGWEPFEVEVTDFLEEGKGLEVTVVMTRRNIFGPLHQYPIFQLGYGPDAYLTEGEQWKEEYQFLPSGILGGFRFIEKK